MLRVLGATRVEPDVALTAMQRTILATIASRHPQPAGIWDLTAAVWPEDPPASARAALQNQISRLRSALPAPVLETRPDGYVWTGRLDVADARDAVAEAEELVSTGRPEAAFELTDRLLSSISGPPYADLAQSEAVAGVRAEAAALLYALENLRLSAAIATDRREWAVVEADVLARRSPYDERRHAALARALLAVGRSADALRSIAALRRRLRDDLGLATTSVVSETEQLILHGGTDPDSLSFVQVALGRDAEIETLVDHVTADENVVVTGEPGVGVSSLLSMLAARMRRDDWLVVLVRHTPMFDAAALEVLGEILAALDAPAAQPWRLLSHFSHLVDDARAGRRLLVIVDDADQLGPSTRYALDEASRTPGVVLVTGNHGRANVDGGRVLVLDGLDPDGIARLLVEAYRTEPSPERVAQLHQSTAGNPLLLHAFLSDGDASNEATSSGRVREVVHARLNRLSPTARRALDWLAVADGTIPPELLTSARPDVASVRDEDPELVVAPALTFRHAAVRDVVYNEISDAERTEIHHALATLATDHSLGSNVAALHASASADVDPARAVAAATAAARDASVVGAHLDAAAVLRRALDVLPEDLPARLDLRIAHGDALRLAGDPAHLAILHAAAADALEQDRPTSLATAMFALLQLGATSVAGQTDDHTSELTRRALDVLEEPDHVAVVCGAASLAQSMSGEVDEALASFDRAEALATTRATRDAVLPFAYLALGHPDHRERRAALTDELVASGRASDEAAPLWEGLHQRFSQNVLAGDRAGMQVAHDEMVALMPRLGDVGRAWSIRYQEAALAHLDGDDDGAELLAFDAYRIFAPVSETRASATLYGQILGIRLAQDRTDELADTLRDMIDGQPSVPAWHAALAHAVARSDPDEARVHLGLALERAQRDFTWLATHVVGARAAAIVGDTDVASRFLDVLRPYSGLSSWQGTCTYGPVDTALALVAHTCGDDRAGAFAKEAAAVAERLGSSRYVTEAEGLA